MTLNNPKRLRMFAGPNGSGKTSLVRKLAREYTQNGVFQLHHFLNADELYRELHEGDGVSFEFLNKPIAVEQIRAALAAGGRLRVDHPFLATAQVINARLIDPAQVADAYVAAAVVDFLREELLAAGASFSFETVMSHRSKIDFFARAGAAGYRTYLYYIATESSHLNVYRVKNRAALGEHDVPEDKIIERYQRCLALAGEALSHAYRGFVYDNSGTETVWLAELTPAEELLLKVTADALPIWFRTWIAPHYSGRTTQLPNS